MTSLAQHVGVMEPPWWKTLAQATVALVAVYGLTVLALLTL